MRSMDSDGVATDQSISMSDGHCLFSIGCDAAPQSSIAVRSRRDRGSGDALAGIE
jgi:hypothetical protein